MKHSLTTTTLTLREVRRHPLRILLITVGAAVVACHGGLLYATIQSPADFASNAPYAALLLTAAAGLTAALLRGRAAVRAALYTAGLPAGRILRIETARIAGFVLPGALLGPGTCSLAVTCLGEPCEQPLHALPLFLAGGLGLLLMVLMLALPCILTDRTGTRHGDAA
ncbi:MAG: hypothetical protein ACLFTT_00050 [Candidatus Hydrogenedentota bacterium]